MISSLVKRPKHQPALTNVEKGVVASYALLCKELVVKCENTGFAEEQCKTGCHSSMGNVGYDMDIVKKVLPRDIAKQWLGAGCPFQDVQPKTGNFVVDLFSGTGVDACLAGSYVGTTGRVLGVDFTHEMVERARQNAKRVGMNGVVEFVHASATCPHPDVPEGEADFVTSNGAFNLFPNKLAGFKQAYNILKPGGTFVLVDVVKREKPSCNEGAK